MRAARCAAPTAGLEAVIPFRRGRTLAGPHTRRAEVVAPYTKKRSIIAPSSAPVCALGHLPPRGKACRRLIAAPTADIEAVPFSRRGRSRTGPTAYVPGALVRETQAQMRNRTSGNFCKPRARWPGGNSDTHSDFRAPEIFCLVQGVTPVNGVRGKANMSAERSSGAVPGGVLVPLPPRAKELAARRRRNSPAANQQNPELQGCKAGKTRRGQAPALRPQK